MEKPKVDRKVVKEKLKKQFRIIDKDNIGVITHTQFLELIKNIEIKLNPLEEKELLKRVDP